jgi:hypothetical protein
MDAENEAAAPLGERCVEVLASQEIDRCGRVARAGADRLEGRQDAAAKALERR